MESPSADPETVVSNEWRPNPVHLEFLRTGRAPAGSSLERALSYVPSFNGGFRVTQQSGVCARTRLPMDEKVYFINHELS